MKIVVSNEAVGDAKSGWSTMHLRGFGFNPNSEVEWRSPRNAGFQPAVSPTSSRQAPARAGRSDKFRAPQAGSLALQQAGKPALRRGPPASDLGFHHTDVWSL